MSGLKVGRGGKEILAGAAVEGILGRTIGARVAGVLMLPNRSLSMTRSFGAVNEATAVFPAIAAFPPKEASAASGAPTISASAGFSEAGAGSSDGGAAAATTGSAVDDAAL